MMQRRFFSIRQLTLLLIIPLFFAGCEQEELNFNTLTDIEVEPLAMQTNSVGFKGRIAISADGNYSDRDDIGATPMGLAIIAHLGLQNKVVHYDYNSHIWDHGSAEQKAAMTESSLGGASRFGFDKSNFISAVDNPDKAEKSIANAINNSSSSNPLYLIVAGPMAVACEGIRRSNPEKRKFVTVISHSAWNNNYQKNGSCTADGIKKTGVKFDQIKDQNTGLRRKWEKWAWLKNHKNGDLRWVYSRMRKGVDVHGDISDAGMVWYLLKNDEDVDNNKLERFFADSSPSTSPAPGPDDDDDNSGGGDSENCQASGQTLSAARQNLEKACGVKYNKDKGHDCDPDGKGGWICSTGNVGDGGGSSGGGDDTPSSPSGGGSSSGKCQASGSTLDQAIKNFENACGIDYNKNKGHDCDPDGKGGWICSTDDL